MKHKSLILAISSITLLASCSDNRKNVLVLGHSNMSVNTEKHKIVVKEETGHDEKSIELGSGNIDFKISSTAGGDHQVSLSEKGSYVLNAKHNDTIIGNYQNYGVGNTSSEKEITVISQDDIKKKIDSLEQLILGKNISAANRNFFVKPFEAVRISENPDAIIIAPFHKMSSIEQKGDKAPEVYRFYTINEIRDIIAKLKETTK